MAINFLCLLEHVPTVKNLEILGVTSNIRSKLATRNNVLKSLVGRPIINYAAPIQLNISPQQFADLTGNQKADSEMKCQLRFTLLYEPELPSYQLPVGILVKYSRDVMRTSQLPALGHLTSLCREELRNVVTNRKYQSESME